MSNYTKEKSLMVVQDSFLNKVKNFFAKLFWSRKSENDMLETEENETNENNLEQMEQKETVEKERKLYNFDADDNDEWPGDGNMSEDVEKNENQGNSDEKENVQNNENNNEIEYEKEEYSEAYREKQELEQKLMNYYESIKKRNLVD